MTARKRRFAQDRYACLIVLALALTACAQASPRATSTLTATAVRTGNYIDAKLGFSLQLPTGWSATAYPGRRGSPHNTALVLRDLANPAALVTLGVIRGAAMPAAFSQHGTPTIRIGSYPAFISDTT